MDTDYGIHLDGFGVQLSAGRRYRCAIEALTPDLKISKLVYGLDCETSSSELLDNYTR